MSARAGQRHVSTENYDSEIASPCKRLRVLAMAMSRVPFRVFSYWINRFGQTKPFSSCHLRLGQNWELVTLVKKMIKRQVCYGNHRRSRRAACIQAEELAAKHSWNWNVFHGIICDFNPRYHPIKSDGNAESKARPPRSPLFLRWHYWKLHIKHSIRCGIVMQIPLRSLCQFISRVVSLLWVPQAYDVLMCAQETSTFCA